MNYKMEDRISELTFSSLWRPALALATFFIVAFGFIFPVAIWGLAQSLFPHQANGSLIRNAAGQVIGSELIAQGFSRPEYFHPRPSAAGSGYEGANSGGTNLGPTSNKLINGIHGPKNRTGDFNSINDLAKQYRQENGLPALEPLPADAVTRSASGLDPDISFANARLQIARVAAARHFHRQAVESIVRECSSTGALPERCINVFELNRALDRISSR